MITFGPWQFPIPPFLGFLPVPAAWGLLTLVLWLGFALVLQFVLFRIVKAMARRTESDVEDVVIDVTRRPLVLTIVLLGFRLSLQATGISTPLVENLLRWTGALVMATVAFWVWRVFKEVVVHYGDRMARRSETRLDDVLLPIVNQFAPLAIFMVAGAVILQSLGVRLDAILVAIGGAAFILAFALQDILSNIFSGMMLLVDTPFRYGDLILLEDQRYCQVIRIGVRVTQLYDIDTHAVVYMPNSQLANERLVNLMQPTAESISTVRLELHRDTDVEAARRLLADVLDGHPDLLGVIPDKLLASGRFGILSPAKREHGRSRLAAELAVDQCLRACEASLLDFAADITRMEKRGFDRQERSVLRQRFAVLASQLGGVSNFDERLDDWKGSPEELFDALTPEQRADSLARLAWEWIGIWCRDPDLEVGVDDHRLRARWGSHLLGLQRRVEELQKRVDNPDTLEQRLDNAVVALARWLVTDFKQPVPPWKCSGASFKGYQDGALVFGLWFFVDNIELEHFFRQARVEGELRREVARRLRQEKIEFASLRQEVQLRLPPGAGRNAARAGG
jgi:MscS family membrane protein